MFGMLEAALHSVVYELLSAYRVYQILIDTSDLMVQDFGDLMLLTTNTAR